jgi:hypothetical protein
MEIKIYKTIIFPVILCGCANWYLSSNEKQGLGVFGTRVLEKIVGTKRGKVTGEWG